MVVGAAGHDPKALLLEGRGHRLRVDDDLTCVGPEVVGRGLGESNRLGGDGVHERPPLPAREHALVDGLGMLLAAHDHCPPGAAQGLVRSTGNYVGMLDRVVVHSPGHETDEMRRIDDEDGSDVVRDLPHRREVPAARISRGSRHEDLRPLPLGDVAHLVVVDELVFFANAVGDDVEHLAGEVDGRAVRQVAPVSELHAHKGVARDEEREVRSRVRLGPRVRLHVRVLGPEELLGSLDGEVLGDIDELAAAVVAAAGVPLGVLVAQRSAQRGEHRGRGEVLRGYELDLGVLPVDLVQNGRGRFRIDLLDGRPIAPAGIAHESWHSSRSMSVSCFTRRSCRPPSKPVWRNTSTISSAKAGATIRPPSASTFASL